MATLTVYAGAADESLSANGGTYAQTRDATSPAILNTYGSIEAGQDYADLGEGDYEYRVYQGFIGFDTSALGSTAIVSAVALSLYATTSGSLVATIPPTQSFTVQARSYDWGASVTNADWRTGSQLSSLTLVASKTTVGMTNNAYLTFNENGTDFQTQINKTGTTRLIIVSDRQVGSGTAPTTDEFTQFSNAETSGTTQDPKLVVTYTLPLSVSVSPATMSVTPNGLDRTAAKNVSLGQTVVTVAPIIPSGIATGAPGSDAPAAGAPLEYLRQPQPKPRPIRYRGRSIRTIRISIISRPKIHIATIARHQLAPTIRSMARPVHAKAACHRTTRTAVRIQAHRRGLRPASVAWMAERRRTGQILGAAVALMLDRPDDPAR